MIESQDWVLFNPSSLSPHQSMVALHKKSNDTIQFTTGSLAGQAYTVAEIQQMKTAGWAFVHPIFLSYGAILLESGRKVRRRKPAVILIAVQYESMLGWKKL